MTDSTDAVGQAAQSFLNSLSQEENRILKDPRSPQQVLKEVQDMCSKRNAKIHSSCWEKIRLFSSRLEPYTKGFDLIVQSHPEIAAIVWGAFRLIITLANSYVTFFQKLAEFMERLALEMPRYEEIVKSPLIEVSSTLKQSMGELYVAIFDFFESSIRVFRKSDGGIKKAPRLIGGVLWRPFDIRFEDIVYRFRLHRDIVFMELRFLEAEACAIHRKASTEFRKRAEQHEKDAERCRRQLVDIVEQIDRLTKQDARENKVERIRKWINPSSFSDELERAQEVREDRTNEWFWDTTFFKIWKLSTEFTRQESRQFSGNTAWVRGNPGYGKTVLASSTVKFLQVERNQQNNSLAYYHFFCSDTDTSSTSSAAYRSILAQVLQNYQLDDDMINRFLFAMAESSGQLHASKKEMQDLVKLCASTHTKFYLILDGIDECIDTQSLVEELLELTQVPQVHCLLFGRPAGQSIAPFLHTVPEECRLNLRGHTDADLTQFLTTNIEKLSNNCLFPPSTSLADLVSRLAIGADGMFLWARLMIEYLKSYALSPARRLRVIMDVKTPEGLDSVYDRIMDLIFQSKDIEQELAVHILMWVALARRPLSEIELRQALKLADIKEDFDDDFPSLDDTVSVTCGGMIERVLLPQPFGEDSAPTYRLIHLSTKEYLSLNRKRVSKNAPAWEFWRHKSIFSISAKCLHYLLYSFPSQPTSHNMDSRDIATNFPFSHYAAAYWIDHLWDLIYLEGIKTEALRDICSAIEETIDLFLKHQLTIKAWIECCYTFQCNLQYQRLQQWVDTARKVLYSGLVRVEVLEDLAEFAHDLKCLDAEWGTKLQAQPDVIWGECTAFTPSRFMPHNQMFTVHTWDTQMFKAQKDRATRSLARVSQTSHDGKYISVLSIWPSRAFELKTRSIQKIAKEDIPALSKDWTARIETRSTTNSLALINDSFIQLDEDMIQNHLYLNPYTGKIRFPIAIALNLQVYVVLRKVIALDSIEHRPCISTSMFPVDFDYSLSEWWSSNFYPSSVCTQTTPYTYWLQCSHCNRYLVLVDEYEHENTFVVFSLDTSNGLTVSYVNHMRQQSFALTEDAGPSVSFHPWLPLLSFSCKGLTFLWAFGHEDSTIRSRPEFIKAKKVGFASCGNMIVVKRSGLPPHIRPVPKHLSRCSSEDRGVIQEDGSSSDAATTTISIPHPATVTRIDATPQSQALSQRTHQLDVAHSSEAISLHYHGLTYGLVRLPRWSGMHNITPSVYLPQRPDESIRIILDLAPQQWYGRSASADRRLPAIIERHSLPGLAVGGKESQARVEGTGTENPRDEGTQTATKSLKQVLKGSN